MSDRKPRRESPTLNAGSMADIAFLLLIFFLVTTTIAEDKGVLVKLPEWRENDELIKTSQVFTVIVNAEDRLLVEDTETTTATLPALLREYVTSPKRTPKQAVVSLVHDRSTSYTRYLEIYDALLTGYHEMWDASARAKYGADYETLGDEQKQLIRSEIPMTISEAEPNDAKG